VTRRALRSQTPPCTTGKRARGTDQRWTDRASGSCTRAHARARATPGCTGRCSTVVRRSGHACSAALRCRQEASCRTLPAVNGTPPVDGRRRALAGSRPFEMKNAHCDGGSDASVRQSAATVVVVVVVAVRFPFMASARTKMRISQNASQKQILFTIASPSARIFPVVGLYRPKRSLVGGPSWRSVRLPRPLPLMHRDTDAPADPASDPRITRASPGCCRPPRNRAPRPPRSNWRLLLGALSLGALQPVQLMLGSADPRRRRGCRS
jgi:hypothetical protein